MRSLGMREPMVATAPPTQRWLLLEVPRAWPDKILKSPEVAGWVTQLNAIVQSRSGRVLFIRRPGRSERHEAPRAFVVVDALSRTQTAGTWLPGTASRPADLRAAVAAFDADAPLTDPSPARLLVCAHGMHDQCCAVRGRPVASVLAQTWPTEVWECSHLGGDRFGANILVLPDGTYFGRLDDISGPKVIAKHLAGQSDPQFLRGVTTQDPRVQAAVTEVLRTRGPAPAYLLRGRIDNGAGAHTWTVSVTGHPHGAEIPVLVRRRVDPPARRACLATEDKVAVTFETRLLT